MTEQLVRVLLNEMRQMRRDHRARIDDGVAARLREARRDEQAVANWLRELAARPR